MTTAMLASTSAILTGDRPVWRAGPRLWSIWTIASIGALIFSISSGLVLQRTAGESQTLHRQIESLKLSSNARTTQSVVGPVSADFTRHLPSTLDVQPVVSQLQRSCAQAGIELASVQIQQQAATVDRLARTDLNISLRGNYPATKTVLAEVMGRYSNISLRRLSMRSSLQGQPTNTTHTETEITAVLALWGAPANPAQDPAPSAPAH
jgi:hypothetical protein